MNFVRRVADVLGYWGAVLTILTAIPSLFLPWIYLPGLVDATFCVGMLLGSGAGFAYARAKYVRSSRAICLSRGRAYVAIGAVALLLTVGFANLYNIDLVRGLGLQVVHDTVNGVSGLPEIIGLFLGSGIGFCSMMSIVLIAGRPWRG